MQIVVGKTAGFCYGVKNAVSKVIEILDNNKECNIYCLGELVHNKEVVNSLLESGLKTILSIDELPKATNKEDKVIIRAHGVGKETYKKIEGLGYKIIDLTCPNVLNIHKIVNDYANRNYHIFLVGQKSHPEVIGTCGWGMGKCIVIENEEDIEKCFNNSYKKILLLAQTTFSLDKFNKYKDIIMSKVAEKIEVKNTICNATRKRQEETKMLSKQVDAMVIIGGKNSSNTKKLFESSNKIVDTYLVEDETELNINDFKKYDMVGIMAGASTPNKSIEKCIGILKNTK